ncbi:hypothetical protein GJ744_000313 [Endocarpon pusillum]|uniref:NAD(P)-binding protein n=1 Tax=Endocarpon pusillum TaxID=364733 RepID=A0A8H7AT89_9EURO|nr:hypothetical protein GJ744_000313 [Endocarpon pusillum]
MKPVFPSPTKTWHNDVYPAIDPTLPKNSHAGQTVIITGAGSGIGRETAIAFAAAGTKHLVLIGRSESTLADTESLLPGNPKCSIFQADITDEAAMEKVAKAVCKWDVLILNAGYISSPSPVANARLDDYWMNYETNVKSIIIAAKAFFPTANAKRAVVLGNTAGAIALPTKQVVGLSGYLTSKLAQIKTLEFLAAENPKMFACSVHPGMIETDIFLKSGARPDQLPMDTVQLPAHFMVWLSTPNAQFLNGKFVWANWDVEELQSQAKEIESSDKMSVTFQGWPFANMG